METQMQIKPMTALEVLEKTSAGDSGSKWCECEQGKSAENWTFFDDHIHPTVKKHHYRCLYCGGITQVG